MQCPTQFKKPNDVANPISYNLKVLSSIYNFPRPSDGNFVVGIASFGGGVYANLDAEDVANGSNDFSAYFAMSGIPLTQRPTIIVKFINGATNDTTNASATTLNTLNVQAVGCACPSSKLTIILYVGTSKTDPYTMFNYMYNTPVVAKGTSYKPNVMVTSWYGLESNIPVAYLNKTNALFQTITNSGISIIGSTGNLGSDNITFPSSSPHVVAIGGTSLYCPSYEYNNSSTIENVLSTTTGGYSSVFAKPKYQNGVNSSKFRSVPDISLDGQYFIGLVNYGLVGAGGNAFSTPLFAGYLANILCKFNVLPYLYSAPYGCFHDIVSGSNGAYTAKVGYDLCTGFGTIDGTNLKNFLVNASLSVKGITINVCSYYMYSDETLQLNSYVIPTDPAISAIIWTSSNNKVATVSQSGLVTSISKGVAIITATSVVNPKYTATCKITVTH